MDGSISSKGNELGEHYNLSNLNDSVTQLRCNENELKTDWHNMLTTAA